MTIAGCGSGSVIPASRSWCTATCCRISPRAIGPGSRRCATAVADNAGLLTGDRDSTFQNKVHLAMQAKGFFEKGDDGARVARRRPPATDFRTRHGIQMRYCRIAQCRQIDAVQRADRDGSGAGGELSVLHHRAECRRGGGARSAARQAVRHRQIGADHPDTADLRRHRGPGARRLQGRGPRQPVPRHHPRGRCGGACGALF